VTLTTFPHDPVLDLDPWVGQRQATFRFERFNAVTGLEMGELHPVRSATLSHDTTRTIKRQLLLELGTEDTASLSTVQDRVRVFMVFPSGVEYPLGVYMFTDASRQLFTAGQLGQMALNDEMFLVDQQVDKAVNGVERPVMDVVQEVLAGLPVEYSLESAPFESAESWAIGATRGQILESLAVTGDYFSPWFGNDGKLHFVRTFDPATKIPDFDFDAGNKVVREPILMTDDLLTAPNRIVVVSNSSLDPEVEVVGTYDTPSTAPYSVAQRGFVVAQVLSLQLSDVVQAQAVAEGLAQRQTVFERVGLTTAPDPRHDSYNVVKWQGDLWLELAWSMSLVEGGAMNHLLRKAYRV
jgi:hypothetical protein